MTNQSTKFEIVKAFSPLYERVKGFRSKCTVLKIHFCYRAIKYIVCRRVCVHFPAQKPYTLGAVKGLRPEPGSTFSFTKLLSFEANTSLMLLYDHGDCRDYQGRESGSTPYFTAPEV